MMSWRITRLSEEGRLTHEQASLAKVGGLEEGECCSLWALGHGEVFFAPSAP